MKTFLLYGLVATTLFAVSASVSLYLMPVKQAAKTGETVVPKSGERGAKAAEPEPSETLRPLVKAATPDAEQTALLFQALRDREKAVKEKEAQAGDRRQMLELVYQDIRGERAILDDLRKQISEEMEDAEKKLADVDKKSGDLDKQKQSVAKNMSDLQKRQFELDTTEKKNIDKLAKVYESMAPESAARIIRQMCDTNRMDTAVKVLALMKESKAAEILAQLGDVVLAGEITDRIRNIKRTAPPASSTIPLGQ